MEEALDLSFDRLLLMMTYSECVCVCVRVRGYECVCVCAALVMQHVQRLRRNILSPVY